MFCVKRELYFRISSARISGFKFLTISYISVKYVQLHILQLPVSEVNSSTVSVAVSVVIPLSQYQEPGTRFVLYFLWVVYGCLSVTMYEFLCQRLYSDDATL